MAIHTPNKKIRRRMDQEEGRKKACGAWGKEVKSGEIKKRVGKYENNPAYFPSHAHRPG
jgi:hypothetical protein